MLTRDEILQILKDKYQVKITVRTFDFYRDKGIIPPIQGRKQRKGLYPKNTPELIASIKKFQKQGMSLQDAKNSTDLMEAMEEKRKLLKEKEEDQRNFEFRKAWGNDETRLNRLLSFLGLKDEGQKYDVGMMGAIGKTPETYLAVFYEKRFDFYRIQIDYERSDNWKVIDKKSFTLDRYEWILWKSLKESIRNRKFPHKDNIFIRIFFDSNNKGA